ncbi:MAG: energy transducer TonB [Myxococcales bacterium]|nr:energy transducer TonB [Myxococcales bacterium]
MTPKRFHRNTFSIAVAVSVLMVIGAACKKEAPPAPKPAAPPSAATKPAEPPKPQSPLPAAAETLAKLELNDATFGALKSVRDYIKANPKADDVVAAASAVMVAEVRIAVLSLLTNDTAAATKAANTAGLKPNEADGFGALLQDVQALFAEFGGSDSAQNAGQIAAAMTAVQNGMKAPDASVLVRSALENTPLSTTARGFLLHVLKKPVMDLQRGRLDQISTKIEPAVASLLCPTCPEIIADSQGDVTAALSRGETGLVCDAAKEKIVGKTGQEALTILATECEPGFFGLADKENIRSLAAGNYLPARLITLASSLVNAPKVDGDPLAEVTTNAATALLGETGAIRLSLWAPVFPQTDQAPGVQAMAAMGPPVASAPLEVLSVNTADIRLASRPVIELVDRTVSFADQKADLVFPGAPVLTIDELFAPPQPVVEGQQPAPLPTEVLSTALAKHRETVAGIEAAIGADDADALMAGYNMKRNKGSWALLVAAEAKTPAKTLLKVAQAGQTAGYGSVHFLSGPVPTATVPAMLQSAANAGATADQRFDRPVLVAIRDGGVDIFPPTGKKADAKSDPSGPVPGVWPAGAQPWYLYETLFKVTIPTNADVHVEAASVAAAAQKMEGDNGGGNVLFVEASEEVPASRLIAVVDALNRVTGPPGNVGAAYPGFECEPATENRCPTHIVVLFAGSAIPNSGKLTTEPQKKPEKEVPEPEPPKEEASAEFCNQGDIQRVMAGRAGAFKFCYERELQLEPELEGRVVLRFNIPDSGKPGAIGIASSTIKKQSLHDCLIKNVQKLTFEPPKGGVCAVRWPLTFNPN